MWQNVFMTKRFGDWLIDRLNERNWSQSNLARASGITRGGISNLVNHVRTPDAATCQSIGLALNIPPEDIFRVAGLLPPKPEESALDRKIIFLVSTLPTEEDKEDVLRYIELRHQLAEERGKYVTKEKPGSAKV